jgi:hypothetical protein
LGSRGFGLTPWKLLKIVLVIVLVLVLDSWRC